jgi:transcriptional regulator with XRE-family HTH domain
MTLNKKEVSEKVGRKIRELRLLKGLTIDHVAFESDMEYVQLSRIERGVINTSIYQVYKISQALSEPLPVIFQSFTDDNNGDQQPFKRG